MDSSDEDMSGSFESESSNEVDSCDEISNDSGQDEAFHEIDEAMEQVLLVPQSDRIKTNNVPTSLNFSNCHNVICIGTVAGNLECFSYEDTQIKKLGLYECFIDSACSSIDFSIDGEQAFCLSSTEGYVSVNLQTTRMNFASFKSTTDLYCLKTFNEHTICVGGYSGHVYMWDIRQFKPAKYFEPDQTMYDGIGDYVSCLIANQYQVAAGSGNGAVTIFDIRTSKPLYQNNDSPGDITSLTSLPDKPIIIAASLSNKVTIFSWNENRNPHHFEIVPEGICNEVRSVSNSTILTVWDDGKLRLHSLFPHQSIGILGEQQPGAEYADLNLNKNLAASIGIDKVIHVWDLEVMGEVDDSNQDFFDNL